MAINKALKANLNSIEQLRKDLAAAEKNAAKTIMGTLKEFMIENPQLEGFRWNQYTPGFNDGEPCEFGVHGPQFLFSADIVARNDEDGNEVDISDLWVEGGDYGDINDDFFDKKTDIFTHKEVAILKKTVKNAEILFEHLQKMENELQNLFGDGVEITVTATGVETENFDHD